MRHSLASPDASQPPFAPAAFRGRASGVAPAPTSGRVFAAASPRQQPASPLRLPARGAMVIPQGAARRAPPSAPPALAPVRGRAASAPPPHGRAEQRGRVAARVPSGPAWAPARGGRILHAAARRDDDLAPANAYTDYNDDTDALDDDYTDASPERRAAQPPPCIHAARGARPAPAPARGQPASVLRPYRLAALRAPAQAAALGHVHCDSDAAADDNWDYDDDDYFSALLLTPPPTSARQPRASAPRARRPWRVCARTS